MKDELDGVGWTRRRLFLSLLFGRLEIPVSDLTIDWPDRGSLCPLSMRFSDSNFGRFGPFDVGW